MEEKIIEFNKDASIYCALAGEHADSGRYERALSLLFSAKSIEPDNLEVLTLIADCYADMGLIELSNKYWFLYLDKTPKEGVSVAYEELAINYFYLDDFWASSYYFHKKLDTDGFISKEGLSKEIIDFFSGEERRRESYKIVYPFDRADFFPEKKRAKHAITMCAFEDADKILSNIPEECLDEDAVGDISVSRIMRDDLEGAEEACRRSIKLHGDNVTAYCNLSTVYDMREDLKKSEYYYKKALACAKGSKDESYKIATCAIERGDHLTAYKAVQDILVERPYEVPMRFFFALAKANTGDYEGALEELKKAYMTDPEDRVVKYYLDYITGIVCGKGDKDNLLPFKYVKDIPEPVKKAWVKKLKTLIKQPEKIVSAIKKPEWQEILTFGTYSSDGEFMRDCVYLLSLSKSAYAKNLMLTALMDSVASDELKRVIIYVLIADGYKERFGVVIGSFYLKIKPRKILCEKDELNGALFSSAYALCMSKVAMLDLVSMDKIGKACDKVYRKLKNKVSHAEVSNEEIAALILSECKYDKFSEDRVVLRMFSVSKNKLKTLKKLMESDDNG